MVTDWVYQAIVDRVYDGDTLTVNLDMGLRIWQYEVNIRLYGINAPELKGALSTKGYEAREALRRLLPIGSQVTVQSHQYEKYGRILAVVINKDNVNVNQWMVANGHAVTYLDK